MVILDRVYPVGYPSLYGFEYETPILAPLEKPCFQGESLGNGLARWICWSEHCAVMPPYRGGFGWQFTILIMVSDPVYPVGYPFLYGFEYEARIPAPLEKPDFEGEYNGGRPGPVA